MPGFASSSQPMQAHPSLRLLKGSHACARRTTLPKRKPLAGRGFRCCVSLRPRAVGCAVRTVRQVRGRRTVGSRAPQPPPPKESPSRGGAFGGAYYYVRVRTAHPTLAYAAYEQFFGTYLRSMFVVHTNTNDVGFVVVSVGGVSVTVLPAMAALTMPAAFMVTMITPVAVVTAASAY